MGTSADALQREVQELREENAALLEALRLAQRGDVDLRGHLSKWNPDASAQGIFTQDWELRYFVLSGTLLKYYSSERDVGIEHPRGVLELQDCYVEVELPVKSSGPFIFQIKDPNDELLLRLSADSLRTAKTWVRTLAAAGLLIQGFERLSASLYQGSKSGSAAGLSGEGLGSKDATSRGGLAQTHTAPVGWGSKLGRVLNSISSFKGIRSIDSSISIERLGDDKTAAAAAKKAAASAPGSATVTSAPEVQRIADKPPTHSWATAASQKPQLRQLSDDGESEDEVGKLQHLKRMSTISRSASVFAGPLGRAQSSRRWEKPDIGDELPSPKQSSGGDEEDETETEQEDQQLESALSGAAAAAATTGLAADKFMPGGASAAAGSTTAKSKAGAADGQVDQAKPLAAAVAAEPASAVAEVPTAAAPPPPAAAGGGSRVGGRGRRQQTMDGASPVHIAAKDSVLTWVDEWSISRHEGMLNLGVVVLVATNIRMIMSNIFTYGLRLRLNKSTVFGVVDIITSSHDDMVTLAAVPGCLLFAVVALMIELLGLLLLKHENKLLQGLVKKEVPIANIRKQLSAAAVRHEWLLFILNLINVGGSLLLPCGLVLSNQSTLMAASALTFVSIVTNMKLTTYAHCNTTLRHRKRRQQYRAAAGKPSRPASGAATPPEGLPPPAAAGGDPTPFATATAAATGAAPDPATFFMNTTLGSKIAGLNHLSQQKEVVYPDNLNPRDLLYFMFAPTLTYQLNFPRIKRRRRRLLVKWCTMLAVTGLLMGFMQVQFLLPLMQSSLAPLRELNMLRFTERLLRLSIPSLVHWLAMFFLVFHLFLNITGELLMFGDRVFYKEWWNAATLGDYWKLWNIPVHKWMLRTVFFPLVRRGVGKFWSLLIVFFISAVMHEVAVGVPLRMLKGWAFMGMFLQVPLISLTEAIRKRLKSDSWGNIIFWASFCVLGQPMCLILYYHDWLLENMGMQGIAQAAAAGAGAAASAAADVLTGGCK